MSDLEPRYPLLWPDNQERTPERDRKEWSQFKTTFSKARDDLENELRLMGAANVIISSWLAIRRDGKPYADQARRRIPDPGVAVYFTLDGHRRCVAVDMYERVYDNLRAIGLSIAALRSLERHGGGNILTTAMQGFAALPPPDGTSVNWWTVLRCSPDAPERVVTHAYRDAVKHAHPDHGGSTEEFQRVRDAWNQYQQCAA